MFEHKRMFSSSFPVFPESSLSKGLFTHTHTHQWCSQAMCLFRPTHKNRLNEMQIHSMTVGALLEKQKYFAVQWKIWYNFIILTCFSEFLDYISQFCIKSLQQIFISMWTGFNSSFLDLRIMRTQTEIESAQIQMFQMWADTMLLSRYDLKSVINMICNAKNTYANKHCV